MGESAAAGVVLDDAVAGECDITRSGDKPSEGALQKSHVIRTTALRLQGPELLAMIVKCPDYSMSHGQVR